MKRVQALAHLDANITNDTWRETFIEYYTTNAPTKLSMVNDKFMEKWQGKYEILMKNLVEKYGPLGSPIQQEQAKARMPRSKPGSASASIDDHSSTFQKLIMEVTPSTLAPRESNLNVVEAKASNSTNGLETSTFTVCTRVRPLLGRELADSDTYAAVVPGERTKMRTSTDCEYVYTESLLLHTPKVSITGNSKLETLSQEFDYVFGPESTNGEIYELICAPVVKRALNGQVGVVFAYGQTGWVVFTYFVALCYLIIIVISYFIVYKWNTNPWYRITS